MKICDQNLNQIVTYLFFSSGIHYYKTMYDVMRDNLPEKMTKKEYEKMVENNLRLLAELGDKDI